MRWTKEKQKLLLAEINLSTTNCCTNVAELSTVVKASENAVRVRLTRLRRQGLLPPVDRSGCANPDCIPYSNGEKKFIVGAHKAGLKIAEIAEQTERSVSGISYIIGKLILSGEIIPRQKSGLKMTVKCF